MKRQKKQFNDLLRRYNRYLRKISRLEVTGRNAHRQGVLHRHIERLAKKLNTLFESIKYATATAALGAFCMMAAPEVNAQMSFVEKLQNALLKNQLGSIGESTHPSFADLDGDGDLDLLIGDKTGNFSYFENTGTANTPMYAAALSNPFGLTDIGLKATPSFVDLDGDGDMDLLVGDSDGTFSYFENTGAGTTAFDTPVSPSPFGLTDVGLFSVPSFADMDGDGDLDMLSSSYSSQFHYFENTGTSDPAFAAVVSPSPFGLTGFISYSLTITLADLDSDGDIDILAGGSEGDFHYFENTSNSSTPAFDVLVTNPFSLTGIGNRKYSSPAFADLDGDGDLDMLSGTTMYYDDGKLFYFENTGASDAPAFLLEGTKGIFGLSDVGDNSSPAFADLDEDGDLDLLVGDKTGNFSYFENTGTASTPKYATATPNPFDLTDIGANAAPTFVNLDGDGDMDLLVGGSDGTFTYFENTGTGIPAFDSPVSPSPFGLTDVGLYSDPSFADLDGDGDLDMLSASYFTGIHYFENTGVSGSAFTTATLPIGLPSSSYDASMDLADLDSDGDIDLLIVNAGDYYYYENTGLNSVPSFDAPLQNPFGLDKMFYSTLAFADLDGDGDMDLLTGNKEGTFSYFENTTPPPVVWDGESDSDWNNAINWAGDVSPTAADNVIIPDVANDPIISSDASVNYINVVSNASLTVTSNSLTVNGEMTVDGSASIASSASLIPLGVVKGAGNTSIQRNTTFGISDGKYSVIGSPITNGSTSSLGNIVYSYDENTDYGADGSSRFNPISTPESMAVADAYFSANTGDISFLGTPNTGNIDVTLVYDIAGDGGTSNAGYNLVSNPYPAAISYSDIVTGNTDTDGTIYLWDDGGSDIGQRTDADYITVNNIGVANLSSGSGRAADWDGYIRSCQGFFVKATTAGTLHFTPSMMSIGNNSDSGFFRTEQATVLRFSISSDKYYNDILIGFSDEATEQIDYALDAQKLKGNDKLQLYSKLENSELSIQALPTITDERTVNLGFDVAEAGVYAIDLRDASQYDFEVYLKDNQLEKMIDLSKQSNYTFATNAVVNSERFSLIFSTNAVLAIDNKVKSNELIVFSNANTLNIRMRDNLSNATVNIYNLSGTLVKEVKQIDFSGTDWSTTFNQEGLFILTVQAQGQLFVKKFLK